MVAMRAEAAEGEGHARTPTNVASLALGLRYLLRYALESEAITEAKRKELWMCGWKAMRGGRGRSGRAPRRGRAGRQVPAIAAVCRLWRLRLPPRPGGVGPPKAIRYGWLEYVHGSGEHVSVEYRPQGRCIGWVIENEVYLDPGTSFAVAQELARQQTNPLAVEKTTMGLRLKEQGLLVVTDPERTTIRKTIQKDRKHVLHVRWQQEEQNEEKVPPPFSSKRK